MIQWIYPDLCIYLSLAEMIYSSTKIKHFFRKFWQIDWLIKNYSVSQQNNLLSLL